MTLWEHLGCTNRHQHASKKHVTQTSPHSLNEAARRRLEELRNQTNSPATPAAAQSPVATPPTFPVGSPPDQKKPKDLCCIMNSFLMNYNLEIMVVQSGTHVVSKSLRPCGRRIA